MDKVGINFGAGGNILKGWRNLDLPECDVTCTPLPFEDDSVDIILAEHLTEHLTGPEAFRFLNECYRILKVGGTLRICCPIIGPWLSKEHATDLTLNHGHLIILDEHLMRTLLWLAGFRMQDVQRTARRDIDGHWKVIGEELDDLETCRLEAVKS